MDHMDHDTPPLLHTLTGEAFRAATTSLGDMIDKLDFDVDAALGGGTLDQIRSATRDIHATVKRVGGQDRRMSPEALGFVSAVLMRCRTMCPHLEKPRPVVAVLAIEGLICQDCIHTPLMERLTPPILNCDRCDFCREHGHETFWQTTIGYGPALVVGDACAGCHEFLASMGLD